MKYIAKAPAKINAGLRVLSKRKDGFHNIETIFYPVKIFDTIKLTIEKLKQTGRNNIITVKAGSGLNISGKENICYKAAEMFIDKFRIKNRYRINISIKKNIPVGAGLGGGSSDAAAVLMILARHFKVNYKPLPPRKLQNNNLKQNNFLNHNDKLRQYKKLFKIASKLGSDVPFFLYGKPAYAAGKGEKLTPLPDFRINRKILIVNPGIHISTPKAYKELKIKKSKRASLNRIKKFDSEIYTSMINDFERVVFKMYPETERIKYDMYLNGAEFAIMSGSGSTVYGLFSGNIKNARDYFKSKGYIVFIS